MSGTTISLSAPLPILSEVPSGAFKEKHSASPPSGRCSCGAELGSSVSATLTSTPLSGTDHSPGSHTSQQLGYRVRNVSCDSASCRLSNEIRSA